ncbi:Gfo/Idh/MocA family protein [Butyrivibrio sp. AE2032]|uniref:Gfo/Idh/MocA family protein n=1 Tax=Butyrivibrio sp. AE2032 TaxID=1458463 RepID=UPI0005556CC1|nr:Gfo/Idh/MocA family oxidoreductase [Butyrivibrio sp. AE2032]
MKIKTLNVCFIGVGSIGKRHIRNLRALCPKEGIELTVDALRRTESRKDDEGLVDTEYYQITDLPNNYDVIFITNPTDKHVKTLLDVHDKAKNFFIEKPISSVGDLLKLDGFVFDSSKEYYVACPMRYEGVLQYIKENIDPGCVLSARSICSSYLPEWRPGMDYRDCYSAHKDMGGGVDIDLIHEWDYLTWLFGYPIKISAMIGKKSDLEIDSNDYAIYISEYRNKIVELHLDYFGRQSVRRLDLFTKDDTIVCDFLENTVCYLKQNKRITFEEKRDDYQTRELEHFLGIIDGLIQNDNTPQMACKTLRLTQGEI